MKYILLTILLAGLLTGCTKDLKRYDGESVIYFLYAATPRFSYNDVLEDSTIVTFAFSPNAVRDSVVAVPVKVTGSVADTVRHYAVTINDSSTAKQGVHFDFTTNTDFAISPGRSQDTMYLLWHRTPDMQQQSFNLYLELKANGNFGIDMPKKKTASGTQTVSTIWHRVMVNDLLRKPTYWIDGYLGEFTRKKLYLMSELLEIPLNTFNLSLPIPTQVYYGRFMQRYLNEQRAAGNTIKEDNGTDMQMGVSVQ